MPTTKPARSSESSKKRLWPWIVGAVAVVVVIAGALFGIPRYYYGTPKPALAKVAAGSNFTCAVTPDGHVKCWGANDSGQLGDGTYGGSPKPVLVKGIENVVAVSAGSGSHVCALTSAGAMKCWGNNDYGQLGDGGTTTSPLAHDVVGLQSGVVAISVGRAQTCAITAKDLFCWGYNASGELGDMTTTSQILPQKVEGFSTGVVAVGAGTSLTCAVTNRGQAKCWGDNGDSQVGNGETKAVDYPSIVPVTGVRFNAISAGDTHACGLTSSGEAYCWGANDGGQLGSGDTQRQTKPMHVVNLKGAQSLSAGYRKTCAIDSAGGVTCWGGMQEGVADSGTAAPTPVPGLGSGYSSVSVGTFHVCAMSTAGAVKCWGNNMSGQLGNGSSADSASPVDVVEF